MTRNKQQPAYWAVIPAAGVGKRMQAATPKQYIPILDKSILFHSISLFIRHSRIDGIVVVISKEDEYWPKVKQQLLDYQVQMRTQVPILVAPGGKERSDSVINALSYLAPRLEDTDWILVHDAARPCLILEDIDKLISQLSEHAQGGLLGLPMADTVKFCSADRYVQKTVDRSHLWRALTPQMFRFGLLYKALQHATENALEVTDESSAMELLGYCPLMIEGHSENIKITHPDDLALAKKILNQEKL